ncbi:MAG: aldehyde ferredoxin oxidoreductase family protein [Spirochaetes bacterium]|nr:aldehyde ferredoxin oxidoreductase family protein [Spirochaetota bacterium]
MNRTGGIAGSILRVNLTDGSISRENTPTDLLPQFLGGRGLGAQYLYREVDPAVDPLDPQNKLIFMNGPLACSLIPGNNKINVTFKSPLTNSYSFSLCGGHWGTELKFAGYDGLIIEGRSEQPVYLWIQNEEVELRSATGLWGKTIPEAESILVKDLGGDPSIQSALIGPAGENLNRMACITAGLYREFGRGGGGAVMGSKMLKGIAIRGTRDIAFADAEEMGRHAVKLYRYLKENPKARDRRLYGTPELVESINNHGLWCTRNFTEGFFEEGSKLEGPRMRSDIVVGDASCYGCPVGCGKRSYINSEKYGRMLIEGPEFETIGLIGANCGISDWGTIVKATKICDEYGFDTMNAGGCVALAMECFEKGILTKEDTGGIDLRFGNGESLVAVLTLMAEGRGIGSILSRGIKTASEAFGAPDLGMQSKGQGLAAYDPRGCKGMALTYATSPKGAHHMIATTMGPEIASGNRLSTEGKGKMQRDHQISMCIVDSIALCATMRGGVSLQDQAKSYRLVTGIDADEAMLITAAERIINLERLYNIKLGFTRKDDSLPPRFLYETLPSGESAGQTIDLESMLDDFYQCMGWDRDGRPTDAKLSELALQCYL